MSGLTTIIDNLDNLGLDAPSDPTDLLLDLRVLGLTQPDITSHLGSEQGCPSTILHEEHPSNQVILSMEGSFVLPRGRVPSSSQRKEICHNIVGFVVSSEVLDWTKKNCSDVEESEGVTLLSMKEWIAGFDEDQQFIFVAWHHDNAPGKFSWRIFPTDLE